MNRKVKLRILLAALSLVAVLFGIIGMAMYIKLDNSDPNPGIITDNPGDKDSGYIKYEEKDSIRKFAKEYHRRILMSYEDYRDFISKADYESKLTESDFEENAYIVVFAENSYCDGKINDIQSIKTERTEIDNKIVITVGYQNGCEACQMKYVLFLVPYEKNKINKNTMVDKIQYANEKITKCK